MLRRRIVIVTLALIVLGAGFAAAQMVVTDLETTRRNTAIAGLKTQVLSVLKDQETTLRRMARRLSASTNLGKYAAEEPPRWRIYRFQDVNVYGNSYSEALNYGDPTGDAYAAVARARTDVGSELATLPAEARAVIAAELATLDVADSANIVWTDQNGRLRANGKTQMRAVDALEQDVIDPSATQSATAVLDKISAAGLIRARQQQSRLQFLTGIVEQLAIDNKRARDTEAAVMNMQLERLRRGGGDEGGGFLAGAADDLRTWKQP
jgi:hypothetical protein